MPKRKSKTYLEQVIEVIEVADLRIRLEIPSRKAARKEAARELRIACKALRAQIRELT